MAKVAVICGYGPGIGHAVAARFGREDFEVVLLGRSEKRLAVGAKALAASGVAAHPMAFDLTELDAFPGLFGRIHREIGLVEVLHWNAVAGGAGDLLTADAAHLRQLATLAFEAPIAAVQAALPALKKARTRSSVLITGGGLASEAADGMAVQWGMMDVALAKAAHHKLAGLLHHRLALDDIYVGELSVQGMVRSAGRPDAPIAPEVVADRLFDLHQTRDGAHHRVS